MKTFFTVSGLLILCGIASVLITGGYFYFIFFRNSYEKKEGKVFYHTAGIGTTEVKGADVDTFKKHSDNGDYATDKNSVYFKDQKLIGADLSSFEILDSKYWSKDKNQVYYGSSPAEGLDPNHLKFFGQYYATDGKFVYAAGKKMPDADPASFTLVDSATTLAKDKNHYYQFEEKGRMKNGQFEPAE